MTKYAERLALRDKVDRTTKMAATYLRKASDALHWNEDRPIPVSYWSLLEQALATALDVVEELPDDYFETYAIDDIFGLGIGGSKHNVSDEALERAEKLVAVLRQRREREAIRRRIAALENTNGRTDAEAESYRAKALELRREHGME